MPANEPIDLSSDEIRRIGNAAVDLVADYLGSIRERRLYPETSAAEIRSRLEQELPGEGCGFDDVLKTFRDVIVALSRHNAHPRMFGYVQAPGTPIAAVADLLASTLNANLTAWRSAPAAVELERLTINWIRQILGFNETATGLFVSGGSMANFAALAAARAAKSVPNFSTMGDAGTKQRMRIYASRETHHSIAKAAGLLGIGRDNVREIDVDQQFKIKRDELEAAIKEDIAAGHEPLCVVANAGTVNTGACDSLEQVREVARRYNLWMHVDASYGGFAVLASTTSHLFKGIGDADSVALDPHKWLYLPVDCGCVIYRDGERARQAFAYEAEYTRVIGHEADEAFAFWDYGPELSRRFRALKVWMVLKSVGLDAIGKAIEKDLACARHLESLVGNSSDFEMLAPVELSIFCFRYLPPQLRRKSGTNEQLEQQLDSFNERLLVELQRDGSSYLSNTRINGRFSLRGCVMNYRTTLRDMEILLEDLRRVAATIPATC